MEQQFKLIKGSSGYFSPGQMLKRGCLYRETPCEFEYEFESGRIPRYGDVIVGLSVPCEYEIWCSDRLIKDKNEPFSPLFLMIVGSFEIRCAEHVKVTARYKLYTQADIEKLERYNNHYIHYGKCYYWAGIVYTSIGDTPSIEMNSIIKS